VVTEPVDVGDKFDYDPPEVIWRPILIDGEVTGYKVDPPFSWEWDHLTTLRHYAALIGHRTGMKVRVSPSDPHLIITTEYDDEPETYDVLTGHATGGPAPYEVTWAWLSGFETGHNELLWKAGRDAQAAAGAKTAQQ